MKKRNGDGSIAARTNQQTDNATHTQPSQGFGRPRNRSMALRCFDSTTSATLTEVAAVVDGRGNHDGLNQRAFDRCWREERSVCSDSQRFIFRGTKHGRQRTVHRSASGFREHWHRGSRCQNRGVRIRQALSPEVDACAGVLARALQNDEVVAALIPGAHRRERRLASSYSASLRTGPFVGGVVDIVVSATDEILGVAAWEAPGHRTTTSTRLRQLPRYVRAIGVRHVPGVLRASRTFAGHRPSEPHWYLADIGIDPRALGQGLGTELLRHRLGLIDREQISAHLEATSAGSERLYERFGFVTQASLGIVASGYPKAMLRAARA